MYSVGEFVVKPNTGICKIDEIVMMSLGGSEEKPYYVLFPIDNEKSKIFVSADADRKRLRLAMTKEEAAAFLDEVPAMQEISVPSDKLREQQYKEAFRTNEAKELVGVIKHLYARTKKRIAIGKKITSTDERYYRQAEKALYSELAFSLGTEFSEIQKKIMEMIEA